MAFVAINARAAARPELGGVERWARELSVRLPALRPERYCVITPSPRFVHRAGHAWEQVVLPGRARRAGAGLVLCPANVAPLAGPRPVVVIHDAAALREPGWYSDAYVRWQRWLLPRIARRAARVVTVSAFSRDELAELLGLRAQDIAVVPGGVDERFAAAGATAAAKRAAQEAVRAQLGLTRPFVLSVASRTARKNLGVLDAVAPALGEAGIDVVVAGGVRPQFQPGGGDGAASGAVRDLGLVDDEVLPTLYAAAGAFVLPSLHEGFGLTCLEAMAAGTPVVAADRGALPETCGGAARLVDPTDADAIAAALLVAIGDERAGDAGRARAASLTWEQTAAGVDAVVGELLG